MTLKEFERNMEQYQGQIERYNNILNDRLISMRVKDLIGDELKELKGYSLFDFINILKILRMFELGRITKEEKEELLIALETYNEKLLETARLPKTMTDPVAIKFARDKAIDEMGIVREELINKGIDPNPKNTIKIEDIVKFDVLSRLDSKSSAQTNTQIFKSDVVKQLSERFSTEVLRISENDKENVELYNLLKLEYLKYRKFIGSSDKAIVEEEYLMAYEKTDDEELKEEIRKELSVDPYNLVFTTLPFDITSFIDYLNAKDRKRLEPEEVTYESEFSGSTR